MSTTISPTRHHRNCFACLLSGLLVCQVCCVFATCCTEISYCIFLLRLRSVTPAVQCLMHSTAFVTSIQACWQPIIPPSCHIAYCQCWCCHVPRPQRAKLKCDFCREYYTIDHLTRLKQFGAQTPYDEAKCSDYCKDYHVQPCRACTTCHFCRYASCFATIGVTVLGVVTVVSVLSLLPKSASMLVNAEGCIEETPKYTTSFSLNIASWSSLCTGVLQCLPFVDKLTMLSKKNYILLTHGPKLVRLGNISW